MTSNRIRVGMRTVVGTAAAIGAFWWAGASAAPGDAALAQGTATASRKAGVSAAGSATVARGKYLVDAMGCHDCHTPQKMGENGPEPDMTLALSGHPAGLTLPPPPAPNETWVGSVTATFTAWSGPWGIVYTRNLTPDKQTGLGEWTEQQFVDTLRTGRRQGRGRQILPPMPWPAFRHLNDADLKAIFAYLQSVKPIENRVPEPILAESPQ